MIKVIGLNTKSIEKKNLSPVLIMAMSFFMRAENDILHVWGCIRNHGASNRLLMM